MVRLDKFIGSVHAGTVFRDHEFELELMDCVSQQIVRTWYRGVYVICDNSYLDWSCTVPPFTMTLMQDEIRWSKWMKSMRKDVECTFGILKGRWRILKAGVCLWGVLKTDDVWLTCCALHNWLLDIDGFGGKWNGGVPISDWTGALGDMDVNGVDEEIPNAIARLCLNLDPRNNDTSGMRRGTDVVVDDMVDRVHVGRLLTNSVASLSLAEFCRKLVEHHSVQFHKNLLVWPKQNV